MPRPGPRNCVSSRFLAHLSTPLPGEHRPGVISPLSLAVWPAHCPRERCHGTSVESKRTEMNAGSCTQASTGGEGGWKCCLQDRTGLLERELVAFSLKSLEGLLCLPAWMPPGWADIHGQPGAGESERTQEGLGTGLIKFFLYFKQ